jgi:murein DD-endopeptidase MepM/ murein hydrolase activator NlpD
MRKKRYHVMIIREDGKQVHNRVLEWFQVRRHLTFAGGAAGLVVVSVAGILLMAGWTGNLLRTNVQLKAKEKQLQASLGQLTRTLDEAQGRLSRSQEQLSSMEELARQQNLTLPKSPGVGGPAPHPVCAPATPSSVPEVRALAAGIAELKARADSIYRETEGVGSVLRPKLDEMSHTPSLWPVKGFITSGFGRRQDPIEDGLDYHPGVDISAPYGTVIQAPAEGLVVFCGWEQGYGNTVEISHGGGLVTRYAHMSKILVKPGQVVKRWQKIGLVGTTGRSTGAHLHYEVLKNGQPTNPQRYLIY